MTECPQLERTHALADGELTGEAAQSARDHVAACSLCQAELADVMQLAALPAATAGDVISLAWYRRRAVQSAAVAISLAAGVALYVSNERRGSVDAPRVALALTSERSLEARLAWSGAAAYRSYGVQRAGEATHEAIPLDALAKVEKRGDLHGVGALALLNGDRKQAAAYLARAGDSPAVLADRAALALADADPVAALVLADEALDRASGESAAIWNRGLALRDLGLEHGAAAAFRSVAAKAEPGWADEARKRAAALDAAFAEQLDLSLRVAAAAKTLATSFAGLALDDARALPGMARIALYDAIRAAPTRDALVKLRPLAEAIDAVDHTTTAVAALAREPSAALAKGYAEILAGHPPPRAQYLAALRAAKASDLVIGALIKLGNGYDVNSDDLPEFARLTAASPDPWFQLLGLEQQAHAAFRRGDLAAAETVVLRAPPICASGAPNYRCMKIALLTGQIYLQWQRLPEAKSALQEAWRRARASGQWEQQSEVLFQFAQHAALADDVTGGGLSLARAYAEEFVARHKLMEQRNHPNSACEVERWAREHIAMVQINQHRFSEASQQLAAAPSCPAPLAPTSLFFRAQLAQIKGTAEDLARVERDIAAARQAPALTAADRAILDYAEGRLFIDRDIAQAERLLRRSIAAVRPERAVDPSSQSGGAGATDANARRISGTSYALLAAVLGKRGDVAGALGVFAEQVGVAAPATCVLGLTANDTDVVAVGRGPHGAPITTHHPRSAAAIDPASVVSSDIVRALAACSAVDVFAHPPLHGIGRILPPSIAWRFVSARTHPTGASSPGRVVVANVEPPSVLGLPRLARWSGEGQDAVTLTGPAATPTRVLAAAAEAGDIVIHAHGLVDQANASYVALSPDAAGHYALTATAVRASRLAGHPLVILAACSAARAAPVLHERWSLPDAFIAAGAKAVIAAAAPIPDAEATAFFDAIREKVRSGIPIAVAVRDIRQRWISERAQDWVRDIIVFE